MIRAALGLALLWGSVAGAHQPGLSNAEITDETLVLTFSRDELAARFPFGVAAESRDLLAGATLSRVTISQASGPCEIGAPTLTEVSGGEAAAGAAPAAKDGVALSAPLTCPDAGPRTYNAGFLDSMEAGHRHLVSVNGEPVAVLDVGQPEAQLAGPLRPGGALSGRAVATLPFVLIVAVLGGFWAWRGSRRRRAQRDA